MGGCIRETCECGWDSMESDIEYIEKERLLPLHLWLGRNVSISMSEPYGEKHIKVREKIREADEWMKENLGFKFKSEYDHDCPLGLDKQRKESLERALAKSKEAL